MNKKITSSSWRTIAVFILPYKTGFLIAAAMVVITAVALALTPTFEGRITSQLAYDVAASLSGSGSGVQFHKILAIMATLLFLYLLKTISQIVSVTCLTNSIQKAMHDLRNAVQDKIRRLPVSYFDTHHFGDVLSRITNDIDTISNALQQSLPQILSGALSLVMAVAMMLTISPWMTLVAMIIIPATLLISRFIVKHSQKRFQAQQNALGELNGTITEMYTGYNEILMYGRQDEAIRKFAGINASLRENSFKAQLLSSAISPLISLVTYLTIGTEAVLGSILCIQGVIQIGSLQAFIRYIWQINDPLSQISQLSAQIQSAMAAAGRVHEILQEPEEVAEKQPPEHITEPRGQVTFEHVDFGYGAEPVIRDLNLHVKSGQMVAIVGKTGAGKTTLINLLMRFYDVKGGRILIDGADLRDLPREELRSLFGMVLQDTWLFSGTIYDNIHYGRQDARRDEVIEAARMANVHHFIKTLPKGYETWINEEANNISQGEKQLLTIARAILKNPQILILDEATSSVDTRLERMLQEAMQRVMQGRTSFVIAHRLSTIRSADLILVIDNGRILEQGTHAELMASQGAYQKLYQSQFAGMDLDDAFDQVLE